MFNMNTIWQEGCSSHHTYPKINILATPLVLLICFQLPFARPRRTYTGWAESVADCLAPGLAEFVAFLNKVQMSSLIVYLLVS